MAIWPLWQTWGMRTVAGLLVAVIVIAGCGGGSESSDTPPTTTTSTTTTQPPTTTLPPTTLAIADRAADLLFQRLVTEEEDPFFALMTPSEGSCFAKVVILDDAVLEVLLSDYEDSFDNISPDTQLSLVDSLLECAPAMLVAMMLDDFDGSERESRCLTEALLADEETLRAMQTSVMGVDQELPPAVEFVLLAMMETCGIIK